MNTKEIGNEGEKRAAACLEAKGFQIIERNWRTKRGEIDIIAVKNDILAFVEVKTLPNGTLDMIQRELNYQKRQRIIKTSKRFLLKHREYNNSYVRFDVIVIDMPGLEPVYHIENAFSE
ncbi:YraN family protein [Treponema bryantii]|uniref:YraN family protein n=1 Tax=Treponema bryantii TaxID=163 RepID=UPI0003B524D6|nr:YraN family protein [Treponema bryantii]